MARIDINPSIDKPAATTYVAVPGPSGAAASSGSDGSDGENAYTVTTAEFTMPAIGLAVDVTVTNSGWVGLNQILYVENCGYMKATAIPDATTITLYNLETATTYTDNVAGGTAVATGSKVSPGGREGPVAADDATWMHTTNNLSDLTNIVTARTNLGLGNIAVIDTPLPINKGGTGALNDAAARTALGVQASHANLTALSGIAGVADYVPYFTGVGAMNKTSVSATARTILSQVDYSREASLNYYGITRGYGILNQTAQAVSYDMNAAGDAAGTITMAAAGGAAGYAFSNYIIKKILVCNASISLTTVTLEIWTGLSRTGTNILAETALSALTASNLYVEISPAAVCNTQYFSTTTAPILYLYIPVVQGAAATAEIYIVGEYWGQP